jgi:Methyltransferase domain
MESTPNAQFNLAAPDSLAVRVATKVRADMFRMFMAELAPSPSDLVLDLGVTSDQTYSSSNYFEALYPYKDRIIAAGIQDASFLETLYPGTRYLQADGLAMPFADGTFDLVHSSAVIEHVGSMANQTRMIGECLRVARRGICLTTPNRWFPIEFHTVTPLIHWLPKPLCRGIFRRLGFGPLAEEASLNLITARELEDITGRFAGWRFRVAFAHLLGWRSNLILFGQRISDQPAR